MIRVLVSENEVGDADQLAAFLASVGDIEVAGISRDGLETAQMIAQLRPDIALVHCEMAGLSGYETCRLGALASPETNCVLLTANGATNGESRDKAMRAGARAIVNSQMTPDELVALIEELVNAAPDPEDDVFKLITDPERMPITVSVTGAKGGIGKTTTATNLALAMNERLRGQVVLVDFVGHYGDVSLLLDMHSGGGIGDLIEYDEIDPSLLKSRLARHESGLHVLAGVTGPESMSAAGSVTPRWVASLLGALRREFRVIVFDVAAVLYPLSQYIFLRSSFIVVMSVLADLSTIRDTGALLSGLRAGRIPQERLKLVVNRCDKSDEFDISELREVAQHPIAAQIPHDRETVTAALNSGAPFVLSRPRAPVSRAVRKLADLLLDETRETARRRMRTMPSGVGMDKERRG